MPQTSPIGWVIIFSALMISLAAAHAAGGSRPSGALTEAGNTMNIKKNWQW